MYTVETVYTPGLAQYGYVLISDGEAAVIDPRIDTEEYREIVRRHGAAIKYIFETHSHADFVTGGPQLAHETGAPLWIGKVVNPDVPHHSIEDGQKFVLGSASITAMHTPGHTPEHISYFVESEGQEPALFSGDLMFVGDLGRPELLGEALAQELAPQLYDSVFKKVGMLPRNTVLYPGHGAGTLCARELKDEPTSTLEHEFATNPALQITDKDEFVRFMMSGQPRVPTNFSRMARLNRAGAHLRPESPIEEVGVEEVERALADPGSAVLDIRSEEEFARGHAPRSIYLGMDSAMPTWLGWLIDPDQAVVLIASGRKEAEEYVRWMRRIGYGDRVAMLAGGFDTWVASGRPVGSLRVVSAAEARSARRLIDVRTPAEYASGSVQGSENVPLCEILNNLSRFSSENVTTLMCGAGYRGTIASSLLMREGFGMVENTEGGFAAVASIEATGATP